MIGDVHTRSALKRWSCELGRPSRTGRQRFFFFFLAGGGLSLGASPSVVSMRWFVLISPLWLCSLCGRRYALKKSFESLTRALASAASSSALALILAMWFLLICRSQQHHVYFLFIQPTQSVLFAVPNYFNDGHEYNQLIELLS